MNIERARILLHQLSGLPDQKFDMGVFVERGDEDLGQCGTTACVAGWCSLLNGGPRWGYATEEWAVEWLELNQTERDRLFYAYNIVGDPENWKIGALSEVTRTQMLEELADMIKEAAYG